MKLNFLDITVTINIILYKLCYTYSMGALDMEPSSVVQSLASRFLIFILL